MAEWKRPDDIPFPQVYCEFDGKVLQDGTKRKYWIQEVTEEYVEEIVNHYVTGFLRDEPMSKHLGNYKDERCIADGREFWTALLQKKISLVCLTKDDDGSINVAGFNALDVHEKNHKSPNDEFWSDGIKKLVGIVEHFENQRDVYEEFKVDTVLSAVGLYVLPEFRGEGLGQKILCARYDVGKILGIKVGTTIFTGPASQLQAARAGFKDYVTLTYEEIGQAHPFLKIPGIEVDSKFAKYMYILYE